MKKEYKEIALDYLFGLMEGSPKDLENFIKKSFKEKYETVPVEISVIESKRKFTDEFMPIWIGSMTVTLVIDGETFTCTRDWEEEYLYDTQQPDYEEDWYYDSEKTHSYLKFTELMNKIDEI